MSRGGNNLRVGSAIGPTGARYWPLEMDDLVRLVKSAAGREMTAVEKEEVHVGIGR